MHPIQPQVYYTILTLGVQLREKIIFEQVAVWKMPTRNFRSAFEL